MKTKYFSFIAFLIFTVSAVISQEKNVYSEEFNSSNSWPTGNNATRVLEVKNGKYYFEHKRDNKSWNVTTRDINLDTSKDFEIETSLQKISGTKSYAFGLMFGTENADNTFQFVLSDNQYRISKESSGEFVKIKSWTKSSSIKTNYYNYNKLKVKKKNNTISFYINDTYLTQIPFQSFFGKKIGILVYNEQKIAIDYLRVKQTGGNTTVVENNTNTNNTFQIAVIM